MKDRRRSVLEGALFHPDLTYAEKVYLATVITIKAEFVNGERRHGSRSMGPDGKFSLHLDYLAGAMTATPEAVRKIQRSLAGKRFLDMVHEGRFGRPTTWQALRVRGAKNGSLTTGEKGTPYGLGEWVIRGAESAPLTYKTPDGSDHERTSRVSPQAQVTATGSQEDRAEVRPVREPVTGCPWHDETHPCPDDCANHPDTRRRRTA